MEIFDDLSFDFSCLAIRYGKYDGIIDYKKIAELDEVKRNKAIDQLVEEFNQKKEETGFFGKDDGIYINRLIGNIFKIDDNEIYYLFFKNLDEYFKDYQNTGRNISAILKSVNKTINDYFGSVINDNGRERHLLTSAYYDDDDNYVIPSIKNLKNKNAAACIECASVAHNLLLLVGLKSYYINSRDTKLKNYTEPHSFVVAENKGKFLFLDYTLGNFQPIKENPIQLLDNKKPLIVNGLVYANARYLDQPELNG